MELSGYVLVPKSSTSMVAIRKSPEWPAMHPQLSYMSYTGLLNKKREGCAKVEPQYQVLRIWEIMEWKRRRRR